MTATTAFHDAPVNEATDVADADLPTLGDPCGADEAHQQDALQAYLAKVHQLPHYAPPEEQRLARLAAAGNLLARQRLIEAHLRLVTAIAKKYIHRGLDLCDLIEEGNIGLIHALSKFDPERGVRLATYATWWIREAIEQAIKNQSRMIRLPVHIIKALAKCLRQQEQLREPDGRNVATAAIARTLEMSVSEVNYLLSLNSTCLSLDAPLNGGEGGTVADLLPAYPQQSPDDDLHNAKVRFCIEQWLGELNERQRYVITHRFGLNGQQEATLQEVAQTLGVTRERTHQIQAAALKLLRKILEQSFLNKNALI